MPGKGEEHDGCSGEDTQGAHGDRRSKCFRRSDTRGSEREAGELLRQVLGDLNSERGAIHAAAAHRLLGIIEQRCLNLRNGAAWQAATFHALYDERRMDRVDALRELTVRYRELMHSNEPVHSWPLV